MNKTRPSMWDGNVVLIQDDNDNHGIDTHIGINDSTELFLFNFFHK